jgi:hypothetical protein
MALALKKKTLGKKKPLGSSKTNKSSLGKKSKRNGFEQAKTEIKKAKKKQEQRQNQAFRVRMEIGEERKVVILDAGEPFFMYEHHYETTPGKWDGFDRCIRDSGDCPACRKLGREGYYVMMLTVIDMKPYKDKNGKIVKYSKKLLPVKHAMIPKFQRLYEKLKGNMRGAVLLLQRDNDKAPSTGNDHEYLKTYSEAKLKELAVAVKNPDLIKPCDYDKAFPRPTEKELRERHHVGSLPGSEDVDDTESGDFDDDFDNDDDFDDND